MDWEAISGLLPAALILAMILRKALRRQPGPDAPGGGGCPGIEVGTTASLNLGIDDSNPRT